MRFPGINRHRQRALLARGGWNRGAIPWGSDLSTIAPTILNNNGDVALTAGSAVTAISSQSGGVAVPLTATNRFDVYPVIQGVLAILLGATPPTAIVISYATVSGTAIDSYTVPPALLLANATLLVPIYLVGPLSSSLYIGAGVTPLVQANCTTQNATCKQVGSKALFTLATGVE